MQIPILNGIYTDEDADFRTSYPVNLVPVPKDQGISRGYLRPGDGIDQVGDIAVGLSRGAIRWNDVHYRVMGTKLYSISAAGVMTEHGTITGTDTVSMDYSPAYLCIVGDSKAWLFDGAVLTQITDVDLGAVVDVRFVDGYFMFTDGTYLIVNELADPFSILPTKYGSSEEDPDPIKSVQKIHGEAYAVNRYTIEAFQNIGGTGFPFRKIEGALVDIGAIGTDACCKYMDAIAVVGGARNEPVSVYLAMSGNHIPISTAEVDKILQGYTEAQLVDTLVEAKVDKGHDQLLIHLPDQTLVYDGAVSKLVQEPCWFILSSSTTSTGVAKYRARHHVWVHDLWWVGDTTNYQVGTLTRATSDHWGDVVCWNFGTMIFYNEGMGAIFHELELVCLSGRVALNADPRIETCYSLDGENWSNKRSIRSGKQGNRTKRLVWLNQGSMANVRIQKFSGTSDSHLSIARLEARIEPLAT